jgi:hypothetical protein
MTIAAMRLIGLDDLFVGVSLVIGPPYGLGDVTALATHGARVASR